MANKYLFYACYKNGHNGGVYTKGYKNAKDALPELYNLINNYCDNDNVFIGIIKCSDGKPLDHIQSLNSDHADSTL